MYNFDEIIDRRETNSLKYDFSERIFGRKDILPMWVADMDFALAPEIEEAIRERMQHKVYGYSVRSDSFNDAIAHWMLQQHQWHIRNEWILFSPGVVPSLSFTVLAYTEPGDQIIVQAPVYYPFFNAVKDHERALVYNQLILKDGRYEMNWDELEQLAASPRTKMLLLCSPHNPGGTVWKKEELQKLVGICLKHKVLIVSDEIHADLVFSPHRHIPIASISDEAAKITITLNAPSKTFNLAAFSSSYIIVSDPSLRIRMKSLLNKLHLGMGNLMGHVVLEAAYTKGAPWLSALLSYLEGNVEYALSYINKHIPRVSPMRPEATYLLWMDWSKTGLSDVEIQKKLVEEAKLGLSKGQQFGPGGSAYQRMNLGCPLAVLKRALTQMKEVF